jgi:hypothetical protein
LEEGAAGVSRLVWVNMHRRAQSLRRVAQPSVRPSAPSGSDGTLIASRIWRGVPMTPLTRSNLIGRQPFAMTLRPKSFRRLISARLPEITLAIAVTFSIATALWIAWSFGWL